VMLGKNNLNRMKVLNVICKIKLNEFNNKNIFKTYEFFFLVKFKFNSIIEFNYNIYVYKKPPLKK
jgi:hypothetical protein